MRPYPYGVIFLNYAKSLEALCHVINGEPLGGQTMVTALKDADLARVNALIDFAIGQMEKIANPDND